MTEHLRMDEAAKKLAELLDDIREVRNTQVQLAHRIEIVEKRLANLAQMAKSWRFVAEEMNGVDPDDTLGGQ